MESIFMIVLVAFNVWTIYFYNKLLLEVANNKEEEEKPPIDPMALVGKSLFKVSQLRKKEETVQKQTESEPVSENDVTFEDPPKNTANKEISYCELPEIVVEKLAVWDEYESDYTAFDVCGIEVRVLDDDLAEAIKYLSEKDREILLMYFFLGMSDTEIGDRLKINRSTSFRSRKNSLEEIKKKLKENMNDE